MQIGDLVRTKQEQPAYDYERPLCIIIGEKRRIDGAYFEIIDQKGVVRPWFPYELEVISESR